MVIDADAAVFETTWRRRNKRAIMTVHGKGSLNTVMHHSDARDSIDAPQQKATPMSPHAIGSFE